MVKYHGNKLFSMYLETSSACYEVFFTFVENALHKFDTWDIKFKSLSIVIPRDLHLSTRVMSLLSSLIYFKCPMKLFEVKIIK